MWITARHIPGWVSRPACSPVTIPARSSWPLCVRRTTTPGLLRPLSASGGGQRTTGFRRQTAMWMETLWSSPWIWTCAAWTGYAGTPGGRGARKFWWRPWRARCLGCCWTTSLGTYRSVPSGSIPGSSPSPLAGECVLGDPWPEEPLKQKGGLVHV